MLQKIVNDGYHIGGGIFNNRNPTRIAIRERCVGMISHTRCGLLASVIMALSSARCAEQNPLPADVAEEISRQEHSGTNLTRVDKVYTGEYICTQGTTGLSLQIIGGKAYDGIYGIFHFHPILTNPNVPAGSFVVKGVFDDARGIIDMKPVSWITRPFGYVAGGLRGTSTDGGNTFEGQITGTFYLCSTFFIKK
jgi:hypothetical protein